MIEPSAAVAKNGYSKNIEDCDQRIRAAFHLVRSEWRARHTDLDIKCDYTWRGPALQLELFKKGRELRDGQWVLVDRTQRVTDKDGTINKGPHNFYPSKGADIYIMRGAEYLWPLPKESTQYQERFALYVELGRIWEKYGIVSGATWPHAWKDEPHIQVT